MAIKLLLAKPAEVGKELAKVHFSMSVEPGAVHGIKLHQDNSGNWFPELHISLTGIRDTDTDFVLCNIVDRLNEVIRLLQSKDAAKIKIAADMLSD